MIGIIMPVYNSGRFLRPAVESIFNSTNEDFCLFLIESESTDGTAEECERLSNEHPSKIIVVHTKREGIIKAINKGISLADGMDVYLTQDDVIMHKLFERDWLKEFKQIAQDEKIGLISAINGFGKAGSDYIQGFPWIGTWSMYIPRRVIDKIGLLDENMGPGDDIEYSYRVFLGGFISVLTDFWVEHHRKTEHKDTGDNDEERKKRMAQYFRKKWKIGEFING